MAKIHLAAVESPAAVVAEETGAAAATKSLATARARIPATATIMDISRRWQSEALLEVRGCRR